MNFLERVIEEKKSEIAAKRARRPLRDIEAQVRPSPDRDFGEALRGGARIIAEVKKKSPRVDGFRQATMPVQLAGLYETNGASAISVVTDESNFGTSLADAEEIRSQVSLPVLVKDFILDPYQIYEAKASGADAVLLITRILPGDVLSSLLYLIDRLGMKSLVEAHTRDELRTALDAGARIIGINNRDLDTFEVTLDTTRKLVPYVPNDVLIVSESGISRREDIEELSALGVHAFLVGGALLDSPDPGQLLRRLLGRAQDGRDSDPSGERMRRNV